MVLRSQQLWGLEITFVVEFEGAELLALGSYPLCVDSMQSLGSIYALGSVRVSLNQT